MEGELIPKMEVELDKLVLGKRLELIRSYENILKDN
jgi:hypothetical protein